MSTISDEKNIDKIESLDKTEIESLDKTEIESLDKTEIESLDKIEIESLDKKTVITATDKSTISNGKKLNASNLKILDWTYGAMVNIISSVKTKTPKFVCIRCKKSEKDLTGSTKNTARGVSIFSPEQMCIDCELRMFPKRFHGCGFCKRPIREKFSCSICTNGFIEWINDVIQPIDSIDHLIRLSASGLINKLMRDIPSDDPTGKSTEKKDRPFILRTDDGFYKWPGFYGGITNRFSARNTKNRTAFSKSMTTKKKETEKKDKDMMIISDDDRKKCDMIDHVDDIINSKLKQKSLLEKQKESSDDIDQKGFFPVWIIPKLTKKYDLKLTDFKLTNLKLSFNPFDKILLDILEKNNIHLYSDIQINSETFAAEQIKTINPYDTRVINTKY
jgi:hypothetical protein